MRYGKVCIVYANSDTNEIFNTTVDSFMIAEDQLFDGLMFMKFVEVDGNGNTLRTRIMKTDKVLKVYFTPSEEYNAVGSN